MTEMSEISFPRFIVLTGNYGSGKTELALNLAEQLKRDGKSVTLVDLDIVNPYFRSAEKREEMERAGIRMLAPTFAMTTVDIPALPAEIQSVFEVPCDHVIFDVGGDDTGAAALGRYYPSFQKYRGETVSLFVLNASRPLTQNADDVTDIASRISSRGRLGIDAIINNTNLADQTVPAMVEEGEKLARECAKRLGVEKVMTSGVRGVLDQCELNTPCFYMERKMVPEWMNI